VIYGDISNRDTLLHAGVGRAEVLLCTLPNSILKGTTNQVKIRQLRQLNPAAKIIVTAESFAEVGMFYEAGADYVSVPRVTEAAEICSVLSSALGESLAARRVAMEARLSDRNEVLP
jgi:voltage-gated potassium channel Kch